MIGKKGKYKLAYNKLIIDNNTTMIIIKKLDSITSEPLIKIHEHKITSNINVVKIVAMY